jgi:ABC-type phosphate transport system permease subunit
VVSRFRVSVAGVALILGIHRFMGEAMVVTNLIGIASRRGPVKSTTCDWPSVSAVNASAAPVASVSVAEN